MDFPIPPDHHHHHHDQTFMFDERHEHHDLIIPSSSTSMLKRSMSFSGMENKYKNMMMMMREYEEEEGIGEKKIKRLSTEQVKALEKSFEAGNKLEGERKMELAKSLGLEPRQIAIWFQNRRARWKTKHLEKEYEALKRHFHSLKSQNHALKAHNLQLLAQLEALKGRDGSDEGGRGRLEKETKICWSNINGSEINSSDIIISNNLDTSTTQVLPSKPTTQLFQCSSTSQSHPQDETFSNILFHGIHDDGDAHHNFWPSCPDPHHFHH